MTDTQAKQREQQEMAMRRAQLQTQQMNLYQEPNKPRSGVTNTAGTVPSSRYFGRRMGTALDDIPAQAGDSNSPFDQIASLEDVCRDGPLENVKSVITIEQCTPRFLYHGLIVALGAGQVEIARYLLAGGAVISRAVPDHILKAPQDQQIPLFELLTEYGWTPNTPGFYGEVLLPRVVTNLPLLQWFLAHGANPNFDAQRYNTDRMGDPETDSCASLEAVASQGSLEAVHLLLDAGARIEYGYPLHRAAGAHPAGTNVYNDIVRPSREFDVDRIPIMELLVERGVDVNQVEQSRYVVPPLAISLAAMAGAMERVRWLVERGANPEPNDYYARSDEVKKAIEEGLRARRWVQSQGSNRSQE